MKVGDLVKNLHALVPVATGIVVEINTPQLTNPDACPKFTGLIAFASRLGWPSVGWRS